MPDTKLEEGCGNNLSVSLEQRVTNKILFFIAKKLLSVEIKKKTKINPYLLKLRAYHHVPAKVH